MGVTSRAPSVSARAGSVARTIAKRREKPYKTEQSRVLAKKRKLNLQTTYAEAPPGFRFLPVGTPDLADRCKELSRVQGLPVHVVNAKPINKNAKDPAKVSHHIHRIGYHFRSEVIDEACQKLGYVLHHNTFVKEIELQHEKEQNRMAQALAKRGMSFNQPGRKEETDQQVQAFIKELFPKIPAADLQEIVRHAWEEGSKRIGTLTHYDLPRRVQLATIARIRHMYTDYDTLLKAFKWDEARAIVEPTCLAKLIEWRGEDDKEDDNEFEEIVRETIIIDGEDDDDKNSAEQDYDSDTSVEISHRPAAEVDLGAESHDEGARRILNRWQPPARDLRKRDMDVKQKMFDVRKGIRDGTFRAPYPAPREVVRVVHVPEGGDGIVHINGQAFMRRDSVPLGAPPTPMQVQAVPQLNAHRYVSEQNPQHRKVQPPPIYANSADGIAPYDRPVQSIEPREDLRRKAMASSSALKDEVRFTTHRPRLVTPENESSLKRRRIDYVPPTNDYAPPPPRPLISAAGQGEMYSDRPSGVIDLTSSPGVIDLTSPKRVIHVTSPHRQSSGYPIFAPLELRSDSDAQHGRGRLHEQQSARIEDMYRPPQAFGYPEHGSRHRWEAANGHAEQLSLTAPRYEQDHRVSTMVDASVAPIQYVPLETPNALHGRPAQTGPSHAAAQQPQLIYVQSSRPSQPVHGAPAAVQQVPRPMGAMQPLPAQVSQEHYYYAR